MLHILSTIFGTLALVWYFFAVYYIVPVKPSTRKRLNRALNNSVFSKSGLILWVLISILIAYYTWLQNIHESKNNLLWIASQFVLIAVPSAFAIVGLGYFVRHTRERRARIKQGEIKH